jgi:hypothetical protein
MYKWQAETLEDTESESSDSSAESK